MKNQLQSNVIINLIRTVTMTLLSFVTFPFVCRVLGDSALGMYTWAAAFVYYFLVLAKISIPNIALRECMKVRDNKDELSMKVQEFFIIQSIATLLSFGLMCAIVFSVPSLKESTPKTLIFILSINFLSNVFSFEWIFQTFEKHTYMAIRSILITAIIDILIFAVIKRPENIILYTFLTVTITILTVISNLVFLPSLIKIKKTRPYNFKQYLPSLLILLSVAFVGSLYDKTDTFILGLIDPTKAEVGSYSVGIKSIEIVIGIVASLGAVFMPRALYYQKENNETKFNNLNRYATNVCLIIVVPAIALLITLATPITKVIAGSTGYVSASSVLIALASMMLTFSICNIIYTQILIPQKKEKLYLLVICSSAVMNIGTSCLFSLVLFKNNPALGVAIGTSVTDFLMMVALFAITWKNSKSMILNTNTIKILLVGAIVAVVNIFLAPVIQNGIAKSMDIETAMLLEIIIILVIDAIIYIIGLIISKEKLTRTIIKK